MRALDAAVAEAAAYLRVAVEAQRKDDVAVVDRVVEAKAACAVGLR